MTTDLRMCIDEKKTFQRRQRDLPFRLMLLIVLACLIARAGGAQATTFATLYSFKGSPDGAQPVGGVIIGKGGVLSGTTFSGGTSSSGTVFQLTPAMGIPWYETVLHNFSGSDGAGPTASLVFSGTGVVYGITHNGGGNGTGTIFELGPPSTPGGPWPETVLYSYDTFGTQNHSPNGPVLVGPGGALYTTTAGHGVSPSGTADILTPPTTEGGAWTNSIMFSFSLGSGTQPLAAMVFNDGALFGTNFFLGDLNCNTDGCGAVYELTPPATPGGQWTETTIHAFTGPPSDGGYSEAALTVGPGGVLYGTTYSGGSGTPCTFNNGGCGTVFQLTPPPVAGGIWTESVIYSFTGLNDDGAFPKASVVVGKNGALDGTTEYGGSATSGTPCEYNGASGCGTVFELTPPAAPGGAWAERVLHTFTGQKGDGALPTAGLALSAVGLLFGTTSAGGTSGHGTVFAVQP